MPDELPKQYDPAAAQSKWSSFWEERGLFDADPAPGKPPHTIMIPLPNVTGALHMGHALNGTLQDLLTRWRRMQGYEALWMPGTDHAGIATQAVVERRMFEEEGLIRHDVGREALVERIWKWKDSYEQRIIGQLKSLGASCDWRRTRFTLDELCSRAVRRTFFKLFADGLIYRGKRLVNWDVHLQTAVADDEVFEEEIDGHFWTFHYPVVDDDGNDTAEVIRFSTTRPETMLGDTAVCVHPTDERYADLVGKRVRIPLNGRLIPIIADGLLADKELGTGAVKVTPAHDPNDYACYQRNPEIGIINILNPDGTINDKCDNPKYVGRDRYAVRDLVVDDMTELGFFDEIEDRKIPLKHSDRSKTPVEPYLSDQWFVKMGDRDDGAPGLAQTAMDAVEDGRVTFFPSRYAKTYLDWLGEKRDWCISRQLWWGHRIPIWSAEDTPESRARLADFGAVFDGDVVTFAGSDSDAMSAVAANGVQPGERVLLVCVADQMEPLEARLEAARFEQDPDVLDTWFSSALWPHATLGWPDLDHDPPLSDRFSKSPAATSGPTGDGGNRVLDYFYPGSVLVTARDIITLWVARMVLTGLYNMGDIPFAHVCVHPNLQDGFGQKMSKSKGNGVDPIDLLDKYGADAVRFTIASFAGETQDVRLPISYECPNCEELVEPKLYKVETATLVVPSTLKGDFPIPQGAPKPTLYCKKCKQHSQFSTPLYDPDPERPVARVVSERFEYGRNFCNKLWNAARFALLNLEGYTPGAVAEAELQLEDRWILSRLATVAAEMTGLLDEYHFDAATRSIREFVWNEFCDWYLEMLKPRLRDAGQKPAAQRLLVAVLGATLRLLQPFVPFLAEELWQRLREIAPERGLPEPEPTAESVMQARWPEPPAEARDTGLEQRFARLQEVIVAVRNVRAQYGISPGAPVDLLLRTSDGLAAEFTQIAGQLDNLARATLTEAGPNVARPAGSAGFALTDIDGFIPLEGVIDREAELQRLRKELEKVEGFIGGHEKKLANENFVNRAPAAVVEDVRETLAALQKQRDSLAEIVRQLAEG